MQATDTSAIQRLIGRARRRIRGQWAIESATTAAILAAAGALIAIFVMRIELVSRTTGVVLVAASGLLIVLGALVGAVRKIDDEAVARRIDRASNLADRLSTAIAFRRALGTAAAGSGDETEELMIAAIRDGVRAVPKANVEAATPFRAPRDLRAAAGFLAVSALAAGLAIPMPDRTPHLFGADPLHARPGETVMIKGDNLLTGLRGDAAK